MGIRKKSRRQITNFLEDGPARAIDISDNTSLAKSTVSAEIGDMEEKELVERYYDSDRGGVLVKLSKRVLDPVPKTIRHLNRVASSPLDAEKGQELLEGEKGAILEISLLELNPVTQVFETYEEGKNRRIEELSNVMEEEDAKEKVQKPIEFDEMHLLKALARYHLERKLVSSLPENGDGAAPVKSPSVLSSLDPEGRNELEEMLEDEGGNKQLLPASRIVEEKGLEKKFNELLEWIDPLLWPRVGVTDPAEVNLTGDNLASRCFEKELYDYRRKLELSWLNELKEG